MERDRGLSNKNPRASVDIRRIVAMARQSESQTKLSIPSLKRENTVNIFPGKYTNQNLKSKVKMLSASQIKLFPSAPQTDVK